MRSGKYKIIATQEENRFLVPHHHNIGACLCYMLCIAEFRGFTGTHKSECIHLRRLPLACRRLFFICEPFNSSCHRWCSVHRLYTHTRTCTHICNALPYAHNRIHIPKGFLHCTLHHTPQALLLLKKHRLSV